MNWTVPAGFGLFVAGAAVGLAQLWLRLWAPETFVKLIITVGVLLMIVLAWDLLLRERHDAEAMRDRGKLE